MICFAIEPALHHSMLLIASICDIYIQLDYYYYTLVHSNVILWNLSIKDTYLRLSSVLTKQYSCVQIYL